MNENKIDTATRTAQIDAEIARLQNERFELKKEISPNEVSEFISNATDFDRIESMNDEVSLVNKDFADDPEMISIDDFRFFFDEIFRFSVKLIVESLDTQYEIFMSCVSEDLDSRKESEIETFFESFKTANS